MNKNLTPVEIGLSLKIYFSNKGMSQTQVADKFHITHSWAGRIYAGKFTEFSTVIEDMCKEAKISLKGNSTTTEREMYSTRLKTLLSEVWTGTPEDALFLIEALSVLRQFRKKQIL